MHIYKYVYDIKAEVRLSRRIKDTGWEVKKKIERHGRDELYSTHTIYAP